MCPDGLAGVTSDARLAYACDYSGGRGGQRALGPLETGTVAGTCERALPLPRSSRSVVDLACSCSHVRAASLPKNVIIYGEAYIAMPVMLPWMQRYM